MKGEITLDESILDSVKKLLGIYSDDISFDRDIIIHINTILANLIQMGIGPSEGFYITGNTETWGQFINNDQLLMQVKSYVYLKVKLLFDPPANSGLLESFKQLSNELEWRLFVEKDNKINPLLEV